jgi:hypothetical protein
MPHQPTPAPAPSQKTGSDNPNWRGGKSLTSNGYMLIRVGVGHRMADVRGYAYEHRLVMSEVIGRPLLPTEQVHHVNGDKTDNRPENLELCRSFSEHRTRHRKPGSRLRDPGQTNPVVSCECGCGGTFLRFDEAGRPRKLIPGHYPKRSKVEAAILETLASSPTPIHRDDLASRNGIRIGVIASALSRLKREGKVRGVGSGLWTKEVNNG